MLILTKLFYLSLFLVLSLACLDKFGVAVGRVLFITFKIAMHVFILSGSILILII